MNTKIIFALFIFIGMLTVFAHAQNLADQRLSLGWEPLESPYGRELPQVQTEIGVESSSPLAVIDLLDGDFALPEIYAGHPNYYPYVEDLDDNQIAELAGGIASGGATVFAKNRRSQPELIDFILFFDEEFISSQFDLPPLVTEPSAFARELGYDRISRDQLIALPSFRFMLEQINKWESSSPHFITELREILAFFSVVYTTRDFNYTCREIPPLLAQEYPAGRMQVAAVYEPLFGPHIQPGVWDRLGLESRAGVLFHEVLRQLQIRHGHFFSNATVMEVTAAVILGGPKPGVSLDQHPDLLEHVTGLGSNRGLAEAIAEVCAEIKDRSIFEKADNHCKGIVDDFKYEGRYPPPLLPPRGELSSSEQLNREIVFFYDELVQRLTWGVDILEATDAEMAELNEYRSLLIDQNLKSTVAEFNGATRNFVNVGNALTQVFIKNFAEDEIRKELAEGGISSKYRPHVDQLKSDLERVLRHNYCKFEPPMN